MSCSPEVLTFMEQCYIDEAKEKREREARMKQLEVENKRLKEGKKELEEENKKLKEEVQFSENWTLDSTAAFEVSLAKWKKQNKELKEEIEELKARNDNLDVLCEALKKKK